MLKKAFFLHFSCLSSQQPNGNRPLFLCLGNPWKLLGKKLQNQWKIQKMYYQWKICRIHGNYYQSKICRINMYPGKCAESYNRAKSAEPVKTTISEKFAESMKNTYQCKIYRIHENYYECKICRIHGNYYQWKFCSPWELIPVQKLQNLWKPLPVEVQQKKKVSIYWFTQQWPQVRLCLQQPNFMQKSDCQQEHCKSIARCIMFAKMTNYCQIDFQETSWQEHDKIHVCKQQISAKSFHSNHKDQMQEEQEDDCEKYYVLKLL